MLTVGDLTAYWGAVAQIIPVLALAFVIEARLVVRRLSRKSEYARRGLRLRWGITFFVVGVLLTSSEFVALQSLASRSSRVLDASDYVVFWLSLVAVGTSLAIVITMPVSKLIVASTLDVSRWIEMRVPWGKIPRLRREIVQQMEKIDVVLRRLQQGRLDALMACAFALRPMGDDARASLLGEVETNVGGQHFGVVDPDCELVALMRADSHDPMWGYRITRWLYEDLVAQTKEVRLLRKSTRRQLRRVDALQGADSAKFVSVQRAHMAAVARMP